MAQQKNGRIINVSSHVSLGIFGGTAYAAAKGGIFSLTKAVDRDMLEYGVTCNVFCPTAKTRLSSGEQFEQYIKARSGRLETGRLEAVNIAIILTDISTR